MSENKNKLSVCILALNEEKNIEMCLRSIKSISDEIVVGIDSLSLDKTDEIAKKYTNKVFSLNHEDNFHINKQKVIDKATGEWILWMDADEYLEKDLENEIAKIMEKNELNGYWIPRKNLIFDKWIRHTGWYPDYQLRLFKREEGKFPCESVHENLKVEGEIGFAKNNLIHKNYTSVDQFIYKLNKYTTNDANKLAKEIGKLKLKDFIVRPFDEFLKRFMSLEGYKDGIHGFILSLLQSFYEFIVVVKVWEKNKFVEIESNDIKNEVEDFLYDKLKDWKWWKKEIKIRLTKNPLKKIKLKILRKLEI